MVVRGLSALTWAAIAALISTCLLSAVETEARTAKVSLHDARRSEMVSDLSGTSHESGAEHQRSGSGNPLFDRYRAWTKAYEKDAREAEEAAAKYSYMTEALANAASSPVSQAVAEEMKRLEVGKWAKAVWAFEKMLKDPASERAFEASKLAQRPYWKEYDNYTKVSSQYQQAAEQLTELANADRKTADEIQQDQLRSQMDNETAKAESFKKKRESLLASVEKHEKRAQDYEELSEQLKEQLPLIKEAAAKAGDYAAWQANPGGVPASDKLYKYVVVPPKLESNSTQ